ncbi:MAG: arginine--tRNA ligase [Ignisphaera sp.]|uniref:Arginine--tRNA ligase n=1 Tax=Ignisphaera aggregans TaxID=334771 RepID=A0A7C4NKR4_9CREN
MTIANPLDCVRMCIAQAVSEDLGLAPYIVARGFEIPKEEFGDIALVLPKIGVNIDQRDRVAQAVRKCKFVAEVKNTGIYINVVLNKHEFTDTLFRSLVESSRNYGIYRDPNPKRIVVEFVSANPLHPLHIGAARNAALGQFLANMLKAMGNTVQTRFYINDVGRQVALLALGMQQLESIEPPNGMKPDHWVGLVYAITNVISEIQNLKKQLEAVNNEEKRMEVQKELDELLFDASRLRKQAPEIFDAIAEKLKDVDIEEEVSKVMKLYESGHPEVSKAIRRIVSMCIEGFKQTLARFGVSIESWDWESDLVWSNELEEIIRSLEQSPLATVHKGALAVDVGRLAEDPRVREKLAIDKDLEIPPLIIRRSDGTTLYTVRDIAYTLKKFKEFQADKVVNVIASEQKLPQAQLRLALYFLGRRREAENLIHYSYEIVVMEGTRMSSRRGRIITLDEILDTAKEKALAELEARGSRSEETAEKIGVAAVKFYLLSVSPSRPIKFSWKLALDFEKNSAPYLLYTYARTEGIFRKARELKIDTDPRLLLGKADKRFAEVNQKRWRIAKLVASFPDVIYNTYVNLDPSTLVVYALRLSDEFNSWYSEEPILLEENEGVKASKILLTYGVRVVLGNTMRILGIEPLERI